MQVNECTKLRASRAFGPYVLQTYVSHVSKCFTCLLAFALYVSSFFTCLPFFYVHCVPSFFTCLTCLQFYVPYVPSSFYTPYVLLHFNCFQSLSVYVPSLFYKMWNHPEPIAASRNKQNRGKLSKK